MKTIIIADDSMFMRKILKGILPKQYRIVEAETADQVLEQYNKEHPDLIFLDIVMPGAGEVAGRDILEKLIKAHPSAKVVMISAVGHHSIIQQCKKIGAKDYIVKPFNRQQVLQAVQKYLESPVPATRS